ncbi:hypothetical protein IQ03_05107 [Gemmobacter caeni]|uniref:Uncharacterized protein n=1 Tax=Gemmobacter caeni TaxID=589035 RepID=A0A2T6A927_9RHOB|nr:hypothetical protein [Gemmobacter caeni]PTX40331.1 hypothetical protein C8N34_1358 [Gemmobacter caeni]TWI89863.1 hypothetical protein IQ03_05107 [Gemmobacter caeni]
MKGMSEREYAAHSGLSRGGVQKARKNGRLVVYDDGSINAAASDVRRAEMTDPDQQRRSLGGDGLASGAGETSSYIKARTLLTVWSVATATFKAETYRFLRIERPSDEDRATGVLDAPGTIHLPGWADTECPRGRKRRWAMGNRPGRSRRTDRPRPLPPDPSAAGPARDGACYRQSGPGRCAGCGAGHRAGIAAHRRGRSRPTVELAGRPGCAGGQ